VLEQIRVLLHQPPKYHYNVIAATNPSSHWQVQVPFCYTTTCVFQTEDCLASFYPSGSL